MVLLTSGIVDEWPRSEGPSAQYCLFSACGGAGVEPAAGSEARGPGTLLSFERSGIPTTSGLNLRAHEYALSRERPVRFGGLAH
jgi:hypothetical protein